MDFIELKKCEKVINFIANQMHKGEAKLSVAKNGETQIIHNNIRMKFRFFNRFVTNEEDYVSFTLYNKENTEAKVFHKLTTPNFYEIHDCYNRLRLIWDLHSHKRENAPIDEILRALNIK